MSAKVIGGTYDGGITVIVECEAGWPGEGQCNHDLEVTELANGAWVLPPSCPDCGLSFDEGTGAREWLIDKASGAIKNYDAAPAKAWHF